LTAVESVAAGPIQPPFEILEHTADIGLRAQGRSLDELFANACRGTLQIMGGAGRTVTRRDTVRVEGWDTGGMLVDLLNELIWLVDGRDARVSEVRVRVIRPTEATAELGWEPGRGELSGTELKAATYHGLGVDETAGGYTATVYFDV
jgi:SHS2 domain-containing protein